MILAAILLGVGQGWAESASAREPVAIDRILDQARSSMMGDPATTIQLARTAETEINQVARSRECAIQLATAKWLQGEALLRLRRGQAAEGALRQALSLVTRIAPGSKLNGDILLSMGGLYTSRMDIAGALRSYQAGYTIYRQLGDNRSRAMALIMIGMLYSDAQDDQRALRYFAEALDVYAGDPRLLISMYNNRAEALRQLGRYDEADRNYRRALELAERAGSTMLRAQVLSNVAANALKAGRLATADAMLAEAIAATRHGEASALRSRTLAIAAQAASQHGDLKRAARLITRSFAGVDLASTTTAEWDAHHTAVDVYRATGRPDLALAHMVALTRLDNQTAKIAQATSTALMAARFDFKNQELRIARLKADELRRSVAFERGRAQFQRYLFLGGAGATAAIIALLSTLR